LRLQDFLRIFKQPKIGGKQLALHLPATTSL